MDTRRVFQIPVGGTLRILRRQTPETGSTGRQSQRTGHYGSGRHVHQKGRDWFAGTEEKLSPKKAEIAHKIIKEIVERLSFLNNVGLDYLSLNRQSGTLSGGESQRIRLASQIGSGLTGVMYVLDEPSIGLHQRDNDRLLETLTRLRDIGNTVIVVEHDEDAILAADYLVDMGPGAGEEGGNVMAKGTVAEVLQNQKQSDRAVSERRKSN